MSPTSRPSKVSGLKRGLGTAQPKPDDAEFRPTTPDEQAAISELLIRPRPEKPVRFTLDLDRERHRYLKEYAAQIEAKASEIIRELLDEMRENDDLRARVRARIWAKR